SAPTADTICAACPSSRAVRGVPSAAAKSHAGSCARSGHGYFGTDDTIAARASARPSGVTTELFKMQSRRQGRADGGRVVDCRRAGTTRACSVALLANAGEGGPPPHPHPGVSLLNTAPGRRPPITLPAEIVF